MLSPNDLQHFSLPPLGALLVEHAAAKDSTEADRLAAIRWCEQDLCPVIAKATTGHYDKQATDAEYELVMAGYTPRE